MKRLSYSCLMRDIDMETRRHKMNHRFAGTRCLHIGMVVDAYENTKNGASISTKRFVDLLRKVHNVTVLTTGEPAPGKIVFRQFYVPLASRIMKRMKAPMAVPQRKILKKVIRGLDILHVQFPFYLGVKAIRIARKAGVPVVSTFHIQAEHLAMNAGIKSRKFIRLCYHLWLKHVYNKSDIVICPSRFAQEELTRYGLTAKSVIISNGLLPIYRPLKVDRESPLRDKFVILSVGRYAPEKRHDMIITAVHDSWHKDRIQLILIGDGPRKEKLQSFGKILPNPPLFYTLSSEELVYFYNMADLYIHAAVIEVECMTVLEAMGCGLPSLIADSAMSATPQFALDDRFLFECDNHLHLTSRIDYWITHPEELEKTRKRYHQLSENYRIENSYDRLTEVYDSLINPS